MIKIKEYLTKELLDIDTVIQNGFGLRSLHTDFIDNDKSKGYRITWVNGLDDPNNAPQLVAKREQEETNQLRKEELQNKPNITLPEMQELLRLSL